MEKSLESHAKCFFIGPELENFINFIFISFHEVFGGAIPDLFPGGVQPQTRERAEV